MLPAILLLTAPTQRHRQAANNATSTRDLIRQRITRWANGDEATLWNAVYMRAKQNNERRQTIETSRHENLNRARRYAMEGLYSKAIRALDSSGIHQPSPTVQRELTEKHPQTTPTTDGDHNLIDEESIPPLPTHISFQPDEIMRAAKRFPRGSSGGGTGFTPTHTLELLHAPGEDRAQGLQHALAAGLSTLAEGKGTQSLASWLAGAPLTALRKPVGGVRPIAVGELYAV